MDGFGVPAEAGVVDVAVVGFGPTGMVLSALLGRSGHRVVALERYGGLYNLPRAGVFDHESMRTFASLGIAERLLPGLKAPPRYVFKNGDGQLLLEYDLASQGDSGWADMYGFYQPDLERALHQLCLSIPTVEVRHSARVTGVVQRDSAATVVVTGPDGPEEITARYVIGCDGGNSFVREHLGIEQDDYGFGEAWMVCDFRLRGSLDLPMTQVCDPAQPMAVVPIGTNYQRISFMLDAEQDAESEGRPERVWDKAAPYLRPGQAELIRVATYTFRSLVASQWRLGRVLLAGDAAHQMPPFLAQGMCSGIRDAQNAAVKLDLVLRGGDPAVLDTYQAERDPHVRAVIERGIELGRVQTVRDPQIAAERDRRLLAERAENPKAGRIRLPGIVEGFLAQNSGPGRGELSVQGLVDAGSGRTRLDDVIGRCFHLIVRAELLPGLESDGTAAALVRNGVSIVGVSGWADGTEALIDVDGTYERWFTDHDCVAVAVRPDFYVYGTAPDAERCRTLAHELVLALQCSGAPVGTG